MGYDDWRRLCSFIRSSYSYSWLIGEIAGIHILLGLMLEDCMNECFFQYCVPDQMILLQAL